MESNELWTATETARQLQFQKTLKLNGLNMLFRFNSACWIFICLQFTSWVNIMELCFVLKILLTPRGVQCQQHTRVHFPNGLHQIIVILFLLRPSEKRIMLFSIIRKESRIIYLPKHVQLLLKVYLSSKKVLIHFYMDLKFSIDCDIDSNAMQKFYR